MIALAFVCFTSMAGFAQTAWELKKEKSHPTNQKKKSNHPHNLLSIGVILFLKPN